MTANPALVREPLSHPMFSISGTRAFFLLISEGG